MSIVNTEFKHQLQTLSLRVNEPTKAGSKKVKISNKPAQDNSKKSVSFFEETASSEDDREMFRKREENPPKNKKRKTN